MVLRMVLFPVWTDRNTKTTKYGTAHLLFHLGHVDFAFFGGKAHVTVLVRSKWPAGKGPCGARVHALPAFPALLIGGPTRRRQRCAGQDGSPADPGPRLRSDEKATLPNPSQPGQVGCEFV